MVQTNNKKSNQYACHSHNQHRLPLVDLHQQETTITIQIDLLSTMNVGYLVSNLQVLDNDIDEHNIMVVVNFQIIHCLSKCGIHVFKQNQSSTPQLCAKQLQCTFTKLTHLPRVGGHLHQVHQICFSTNSTSTLSMISNDTQETNIVAILNFPNVQLDPCTQSVNFMLRRSLLLAPLPTNCSYVDLDIFLSKIFICIS